MNNSGKNFAIWIIVALVLVLLFNMFEGGKKAEKSSKIPYSEFLKLVETDKINDVSMVGRNIVGHLDDGSKFSTYTPPNDPNLIEKLSEHNIVINAAGKVGGILDNKNHQTDYLYINSMIGLNIINCSKVISRGRSFNKPTLFNSFFCFLESIFIKLGGFSLAFTRVFFLECVLLLLLIYI